jgi:hypothetical protein
MNTLIWDLEIALIPNENLYERLYTGFLRPGFTMSGNLSYITSFGYKWLGEDKAHCLSIHDFKGFKKNVNDDRELCLAAREIMMEAGHLVAHYGDKFDRKFIETRLLLNGIHPIPEKKLLHQSDTCAIAKNRLKFDSNKLDVLAKALGLETKMKKEWPHWWIRAMKGDKEALSLMAAYCKQDIVVLEQVYNRLSPLDTGPVNRALSAANDEVKDDLVCINCLSEDIKCNGHRYNITSIYQRYSCNSCGKFFAGTKKLNVANY